MSQVLRHTWAVFATLLILDVLLCVAWFLAIPRYPSLVHNSLADLMPLAVAYTLVPVILSLAVAAGLARRVVQFDAEPGASKKLDLLARPAFAALLFVLGVGLVIAFGDGPGELGVAEAALALSTVFACCYLVLSFAAVVVRKVTARGLTVLFVVAVLGAGTALMAIEARGRTRLAAQQEAARVEVAAEKQRQQARVRPVISEPALNTNAVDTYRSLIEAQRAQLKDGQSQLPMELNGAVEHPDKIPSPAVMSALARSRGDLDQLLQATRASRAVWPIDYEKGFRAEFPSVLPARALAHLALVDANLKAQEGDVKGAAERYLAVLRFGADFASGPLVPTLTGGVIERKAVEALARLVRSPRGAPALEAIDLGLERLTPALADLESGLRNERLLFAMTGPQEDLADFARHIGLGSTGGVMAVISPLIPWSAYLADGVSGMNATLKDIEMALASGKPGTWQKLEEDFLPRYYFSNPSVVYRTAVPSMMRAQASALEAPMLVAATRLAITLERRRATEGRYPVDPGVVPSDPFSKDGASLRYRVADDGAGYVLYSVGWDHKDDGGKANVDLVLPEAAWPSVEKAKPARK